MTLQVLLTDLLLKALFFTVVHDVVEVDDNNVCCIRQKNKKDDFTTFCRGIVHLAKF